MGFATNALLSLALVFFGLMIGTLTGISQSPVVAVLLPLVFSLATAGGAVYIARAPQKSDALLGPTMPARARLLAVQLLAFSAGFLPGLWLGVDAKFSPSAYWAVNRPPTFEPRFSEYKFKEIEVLRAARAVDVELFRAQVPGPERRRLLKDWLDAIDARRVDGELSTADASAIETLLGAVKEEATLFDSPTWPSSSGPNRELGPVAEYIPSLFEEKPDKDTSGA